MYPPGLGWWHPRNRVFLKGQCQYSGYATDLYPKPPEVLNLYRLYQMGKSTILPVVGELLSTHKEQRNLTPRTGILPTCTQNRQWRLSLTWRVYRQSSRSRVDVHLRFKLSLILATYLSSYLNLAYLSLSYLIKNGRAWFKATVKNIRRRQVFKTVKELREKIYPEAPFKVT